VKVLSNVELVRELQRQGWKVLHGARHYRAYPPDRSKAICTISVSPSDVRTMRNCIAQCRRSGAVL